MSDGPHKTLNMSRPWRGLAKLAGNCAHSETEVTEAFRPALLADWTEVRPDFAQTLRNALGETDHGLLFPELAQQEVLRARAKASNPIEALFADHVLDVCRDGARGAGAYLQAVKNCLEEQGGRRALQMEEHYLREAAPAAPSLRARLCASLAAVDTAALAAGIVAGATNRSLAPKVDRSGLDDGVPL